jgi:ribulose-phosphate 3-epimerase
MSRSQPLEQLRAAAPAILPSMLLCDFGNLEREVEKLLAAGVPGFHLDVMDGNFVPNLTYGVPVVQALRRLTRLPLDVHLMIQRPENYLDQFRDAGADVISFHIEATQAPRPLLKAIRAGGAAAGVAINPATPLSAIEDCLDLCDLVLVMSVPAGFGGQAFNPVALARLQQLRERLGEEFTLEVDGGISPKTIADCAAAGADLFVVGSAIFKSEDYRTVVTQLRELAQGPGATGFH